MGRQCHFILALIFFPAVLSLDFGGSRVSRNTHFHVDVEGPIGSVVDFPDHHIRKRRSADDGGDTCNGLQGYKNKLSNNTHSVSFNRLFQLLACHLTFGLCQTLQVQAL